MISFRINDNILEAKLAMNYDFRMNFWDSLTDLLKNVFDCILIELIFFNKLVKIGSCILGENVDILLVLEMPIDLNDIGVLDEIECRYLIEDVLIFSLIVICYFIDSLFGDNFQCIFFVFYLLCQYTGRILLWLFNPDKFNIREFSIFVDRFLDDKIL